MADINRVQLLGRIGADAEFRFTQGGKEVASFSLATDTGRFDKESNEWRKNVQWHRVYTFQSRLLDRLRERGKKGTRVIVEGEIRYRSYRKEGESTDRKDAEIEVGSGGNINFIDADRAE